MILIAEDNQLMRKMIRSLVEDLDSEIIECADGEAAFNLYEKHLPDWVLMDVSMQPVNGLTATRSIIGKFPAARIVIVTEHDDEETREHAFTAGACEFLGKSDLRRLRTLIGGH
ncbi:MAG TPA: response regulator transcription factor [Pyrinomonadaceae bacterium]|jgi:DNA-binding NarL/FixJ family response regulator